MNLERRPLWTCPRCRAKFVTRNIYHGCGNYSVAKFLEGKGDRARTLYERFAELVRRCGPIEVAPTKTQVGFMVRVRFAGITHISDRGMTAQFALPRRLDNPRIRRVDHPAHQWYIHTFRVTSPEELDDEVLGWLKESYKMGEQQHLKP